MATWDQYAVGGAAARPDSFTGLQPAFSSGLLSMLQDAHAAGIPLQVTSAYRSPELQAQLYDEALRKYGDEATARRWVAPPGRSQHNFGTAADFAINGQLIRDGNSPEARWIRENAARYGLAVPMEWEPWQVELAGARADTPVDVARDTRAALGYGAPQQNDARGSAPMMPPREQPQGLLQMLGIQPMGEGPQGDRPFYQRDQFGNVMGNIAVAANMLRQRPDQNVPEIVARGRMRRDANRTAEWLAQQEGGAEFAQAILSGANPGEVLMAYRQSRMAPQVDGVEVNGRLVDRNTGRVIADFSNADESGTAAFRTLQQRAEAANLTPGTPEYTQFMINGGQTAGIRLKVGPDGTIEFSEGGAGGGAGGLTDADAKSNIYYTRAAGALANLDPVDEALLDLGDNWLSADPTGIVRGRFQSEEYQQAQQAAEEFLQAILRKDTGAAITAQEQELYGQSFLPQLGDGPAVIAQKREARARALRALRTGMSAENILRAESAARGEDTEPTIEELLEKY